MIKQCCYGDDRIFEILKKNHDYSALKQLIGKAQTFAGRYFISVSISRLYPIELLEKWVHDDPDCADAFLCYGARMVQHSWSARGYGRGADISKDKWQNFYERLEKTREILLQCAKHQPDDPTPWAYLIMVSTWHGDSIEVRREYFQQAQQRDPHNWVAHMHMIIALSQKWGGDNDVMVAFAEKASNNAPEGSDLPAILIKAYIEYWKYLAEFQNKPREALEFLNRQSIEAQAIKAYERSLDSDQHQETRVSIFARYNTSSWFWIMKDRERLGKDLNYLGNRIEDIHWRWAGSEGDLAEAKASCFN